jgi:hypothetical protein
LPTRKSKGLAKMGRALLFRLVSSHWLEAFFALSPCLFLKISPTRTKSRGVDATTRRESTRTCDGARRSLPTTRWPLFSIFLA